MKLSTRIFLASAIAGGVNAFAPQPVAFRTSSVATQLDAAKIEFIPGLEEKDVPEVKLTRARDGSSGVATFRFNNPNVFDASTQSKGEITGPCVRARQ
jgi:photosystem II protein